MILKRIEKKTQISCWNWSTDKKYLIGRRKSNQCAQGSDQTKEIIRVAVQTKFKYSEYRDTAEQYL